MSESESIATRTAQTSASRTEADELPPDLAARTVPEREGLPRSYRMRADAHYVDQLEAPAQPVIRLVKTGQIDCRDVPSPDRVEALTKSIAMHGLLQPLLVRRQGGRYTLIAGRKRLAAAIAAGLGAVPCALHDAEGTAAAALAEADNVRPEDAGGSAAGEREALRPLLESVASDLAAIRTSISLLKVGRGGALTQRVGADLIASQAARAAWLIEATLGTIETNRLSPLAAIVQRVEDTFAAHASLVNLRLECSVAAAAGVWKLPDDPVAAAINGAVFATLSLLEGSARPAVEVHAESPHARALRIEVVQRSARIPAGLGEQESGHLGELIPALALRLARAVAAPHGGGAELTPLPGAGSVLQITFAAPQIAG